jgi:hypothetical protein
VSVLDMIRLVDRVVHHLDVLANPTRQILDPRTSSRHPRRNKYQDASEIQTSIHRARNPPLASDRNSSTVYVVNRAHPRSLEQKSTNLTSRLWLGNATNVEYSEGKENEKKAQSRCFWEVLVGCTALFLEPLVLLSPVCWSSSQSFVPRLIT